MAKLFVIAGHGAGDPGACGNGYNEAERVRALASRIKDYGGDSVLLGDFNRNYYRDNGIVKLNIPKDYQILELHLDSGASSAHGAHLIIYKGLTPDKYDTALAKFITGVFPGRSNSIVNRGDLANPYRAFIKGYGYRLMECGFISNSDDISKFNTNIDDIAKGILESFDIESVSTAKPSIPAKPNITNPSASVNAANNAGGSKGDIIYQVYISKYGWLDCVVNYGSGDNGYAGIYGSPIKAVRGYIKGSAKNVGYLDYRVHVKGKGYYNWQRDMNKDSNGENFAGDCKNNIDGLQMKLSTGKKIKYRVHILGGSWLDWVIDCGSGNNGYAGIFGKSIDGIQIATL